MSYPFICRKPDTALAILALLTGRMHTPRALTSASSGSTVKALVIGSTSTASGATEVIGVTAMVSESKTRCLENRNLLAGSRYRIARSRRLLNPAFGISGGSAGDDLYETVRDRLASGTLFLAPQKVWAGHGTGRICIVCDAAITASDVEHEMIDGPATIWTHSACHQIWRQESTSYELANVMEGTDYLADLRQLVRERFVEGALFVLPNDKSWLGLGVTDICAVCNKPIFAAESSHEVTGLRRAHAHLVCYRAWLVESREERASAESHERHFS